MNTNTLTAPIWEGSSVTPLAIIIGVVVVGIVAAFIWTQLMDHSPKDEEPE